MSCPDGRSTFSPVRAGMETFRSDLNIPGMLFMNVYNPCREKSHPNNPPNKSRYLPPAGIQTAHRTGPNADGRRVEAATSRTINASDRNKATPPQQRHRPAWQHREDTPAPGCHQPQHQYQIGRPQRPPHPSPGVTSQPSRAFQGGKHHKIKSLPRSPTKQWGRPTA